MGFNEEILRIYEIIKTTSQTDLSKILDIRRATISDAKNRNSIPADWHFKISEKYGSNPIYTRYGKGPKYLSEITEGQNTTTEPPPPEQEVTSYLISKLKEIEKEKKELVAGVEKFRNSCWKILRDNRCPNAIKDALHAYLGNDLLGIDNEELEECLRKKETEKTTSSKKKTA